MKNVARQCHIPEDDVYVYPIVQAAKYCPVASDVIDIHHAPDGADDSIQFPVPYSIEFLPNTIHNIIDQY